MERDDAQRTLGDIERMRLGTRRLLNPLWFFNIVFGLFFAGTALIVVADAPGPVAAVYWGVGGLLAVSWSCASRSRSSASLASTVESGTW
jgi:hypothetical protein